MRRQPLGLKQQNLLPLQQGLTQLTLLPMQQRVLRLLG